MEKYLTGKVFKSVRLVMSGGMPLPKKVVKSYYNIFPNAKVINFYGCTENSPRVCHFEVKRKDINNYIIFPVGKALNGIKVKIIKKTKKDKSGIICISGKSLMRGYYRNKQLNREKLVNSWFNTGDIGFIDKERNLSKNITIPISLWDERLSSEGTFKITKELGTNVSKRVRNLDKNAAAFILQGAIDYLSN